IFGNSIRRVDGCGNDTLYEYDALNRPVREARPQIHSVRTEKRIWYDDANNTITTTDENGNYTRIDYTPLGQPHKAWLAAAPVPSARDILVKEYCYDDTGRLIEERILEGVGEGAEQLRSKTLYAYDAFDRVISKEVPAVNYRQTYRYDEVCALPFDPAHKGAVQEVTLWGDVFIPCAILRAAFGDGALRAASGRTARENQTAANTLHAGHSPPAAQNCDVVGRVALCARVHPLAPGLPERGAESPVCGTAARKYRLSAWATAMGQRRLRP
ncbi:MAG: hypothetical protein RR075_07340, partial [Pygmaiobacter sp.]